MRKKGYVPMYTITDKTVNLVSAITEKITKITIKENTTNNPKLRRDNRICAIHATLAMSKNSLSLEQMTEITNGKNGEGTLQEVAEVKNTFEAYSKVLEMDPYSMKDMLAAHKILMKDLIKKEEQLPQVVKELIDWAKKAEVHPLIKSSVFHYTLECIHPFEDGNGRMGRMWQMLLLYQWNSIFGWLPVEELIQERHEEYHLLLSQCHENEDSGKFIEYILTAIYDVLCKVVNTVQVTEQVIAQVDKLLNKMSDKEYTTREMMELLALKHRPSFRDNYLLPSLELGYIEMTIPDKPTSSKQKYLKVAK